MIRHLRTGVACGALGLTALAPTTALAQDDAPPIVIIEQAEAASTPGLTRHVLASTALGYAPVATPEVDADTVTFAIEPVAAMEAANFSATVEAVGHPIEVVVTTNGDTAETLTLERGARAEITIPLPPNATAIEITGTRLDDSECRVLERPGLFRVRDAAFGYAGTHQPPHDLQQWTQPGVELIVIGVERDRSPAAVEALLQLAAITSRTFPDSQLVEVVSIDELGDHVIDTPFHRVVTIRERSAAGVSLTDGVLEISGTGSALVDQVRALGSDLVSTGGVTSFLADPMPPVTAVVRDAAVPIADIVRTTSVEGAFHLELPLALDQVDIGNSVGSYEVRLGGIASPPPGDTATDLQLSLAVGDRLLDVVPVGRDGRFDVHFETDADDSDATTLVRLVLDGPRQCGDPSRWSLQLDEGSWVHASSGDSLAPGFHRFRVAAASGLAVDPGDELTELAAAASIVAALQESMVDPFPIAVVDRSGVLAPENATLVVGPDREVLKTSGAPIVPGREGTDGSKHLTFDGDVSVPHVTLQSYSFTDTELLAITLGDSDSSLPAALGAIEWGALKGAVAVIDTGDDDLDFPGVQAAAPAEVQGRVLLRELTSPARSGRQIFVYSFVTTVTVAAALTLVLRAVRSLVRRTAND